MKIKLNLRSIIRYEQMSGQSFNCFNYSNEEQLLMLLYNIVISNNDELFLYDEFKQMVESKKIGLEIFNKFNKELKYIEQYSNKTIDAPTTGETGETSTVVMFIKDIVGLLSIQAGLDINYILSEMTVFDITFYMNSYNDRIKQDLEKRRLFTWLSILPHIDGSKINSPTKFYPFAWEMEQIELEEKEQMNQMKNDFEDFMNNNKVENNE